MWFTSLLFRASVRQMFSLFSCAFFMFKKGDKGDKIKRRKKMAVREF